MSEASNGSGCCIKCGQSLPTPSTFCGKCGAPQTKSKKCIACGKGIVLDVGNFCVHCGHDQQKPVETKSCIHCGFQLLSSAPFCSGCGWNQLTQPVPQQPCLLCQTRLPESSSSCPVCLAFTDRNIMSSILLKNCVNPYCQVPLMNFVLTCYKCQSSQQTLTQLPPAGSQTPMSSMNYPFLSPLMFSMPSHSISQSKYCTNCKAVIAEQSEVCEYCQNPQPRPTPQQLMVAEPTTSYQGSSPQASRSFPTIAARFPSQFSTTLSPLPHMVQGIDSFQMPTGFLLPTSQEGTNMLHSQSSPHAVEGLEQVHTTTPQSSVHHPITGLVNQSTCTSGQFQVSEVSVATTGSVPTTPVDSISHPITSSISQSSPEVHGTSEVTENMQQHLGVDDPVGSDHSSSGVFDDSPMEVAIADEESVLPTVRKSNEQSSKDGTQAIESGKPTVLAGTSSGARPLGEHAAADDIQLCESETSVGVKHLKDHESTSDHPIMEIATVEKESVLHTEGKSYEQLSKNSAQPKPDISSGASPLGQDASVSGDIQLHESETSPIGAKHLNDSESPSDHPKQSKTDDKDHCNIESNSSLVSSNIMCISKRLPSGDFKDSIATDPAKRSKIDQEVFASEENKRDVNIRNGGGHHESEHDSVIDPVALHSGAVVKEKVADPSNNDLNPAPNGDKTKENTSKSSELSFVNDPSGSVSSDGPFGKNGSMELLNSQQLQHTSNDPLTTPLDKGHNQQQEKEQPLSSLGNSVKQGQNPKEKQSNVEADSSSKSDNQTTPTQTKRFTSGQVASAVKPQDENKASKSLNPQNEDNPLFIGAEDSNGSSEIQGSSSSPKLPHTSHYGDGSTSIAEEESSGSSQSTLVPGSSSEQQKGYKKEDKKEVLFEGTKGKKKGDNSDVHKEKEKGKKDNNSVKEKDTKEASVQEGKYNPNIWKDGPSGLLQSPENSKLIVFHAILPSLLWDWDSQSKVYIRFGHPKLGDWHCDCGPMKLIRQNIGKGILVMSMELRIASKVLESVIPYKYTVFSPKTRNATDKDQIYEFIDTTDIDGVPNSVFVNRVLLPEDFQDQKDGHRLVKFKPTKF